MWNLNKMQTGVNGDPNSHVLSEVTAQELQINHWALESAINPIAIADLAGKIEYVNPAFLRLWRYNTTAEVLGLSAASFWQNPEKVDEVVRALESTGCWVGELDAKAADNSVFYVKASASLIRNEAGEPIRMMASVVDITEYKQAVEALRKSEDKYRTIFENTAEGIFQVTPDGRLIIANPALARSLGYASVEELRNAVTNIQSTIYTNPGDRETLQVLLFRDGYVNDFDVECRKKDGGTIWIQLNIRLVKDSDGKVLYHEGVGRDITGRKKAEAALLESESRFRKIVEQAPIAMAVVSMDAVIEFINCKAIQVFGYQPEEIPTMAKWWELAYPDERYRQEVIGDWMGRIQKALDEGGEIAGNEYRATCKNGAVKTIFISGVPVAGKIFVLFDDITQRKQAEKTLRLRESYLSAIIENQPGLLWMKDPAGRFLAVNTRFANSSGQKSAEALVGKTDFDIWPAELAAGYVADDEKVIKSGLPRSNEEQIQDQGTIRWFETFKAPIVNEQGVVIGTTGCSRDITDRKRAEMSLQNTQKLESLGILAGGIAHDFNNLLTGIYGYMDLALAVSKDPQLVEYFERMLSTMNRAKALTLQLLTFAKGGAPVQKITPLIPFVQETARFALSGSNSSCNFALPGNLWPCNIDKNQIGQVIDNIVINAQQAMPGGGTIEVVAKNITFKEKEHHPLAPGNYVCLSIIDSGIGIPKEIIPHIFDPFYTTKSKGHGLGLATCHSIISRHGGCIEVVSEPGRGSTFTVYLPASPQTVAVNETVVRKHPGSGTILVMDDEDVVRHTFQKMLEMLGYTVVGKKNGREVVDFFSSEPAGTPLIGMIFDLTVPGGMGGVETVKEIRKLNATIPIFVSSGYADNSVMRNPAAYGFTASIGKPFTMAEISETLNAHLKRT